MPQGSFFIDACAITRLNWVLRFAQDDTARYFFFLDLADSFALS